MDEKTVQTSRVCRKCGISQPETLEFFWAAKSNPRGLDPTCKACRNAAKLAQDRAQGVKPRQPPRDRFWSKVTKNGPTAPHMATPCWDWTATLEGGYGRFRTSAGAYGRRAMVLAHRFAWELENGSIANTIEVCHRRDRPSCVRPSHLFLGTHADNMRDAASKQRMGKARGERSRKARLTEALVVRIRAEFSAGAKVSRLARCYGVGFSCISAVVRRQTWRHVG